MGYELNRLMRQFGVSSPTVAYSGSPMPVAPVDPGASATDEQKTEYATLLNKYNVAKPQYEADRAAYEPYKQAYQERVMNTPQYIDAQFQTGPSAGMAYVSATPNIPTSISAGTEDQKRSLYQNLRDQGFSDALIRKRATEVFGSQTNSDWNALTSGIVSNNPTQNKGIGVDAYRQNIRNYVANNPNATPFQIRAEMDKYGISGYDVAQARGGSMWGTPLAMPTYGASSASSSMGAPLALPSNVNLNIGGDFSGVDFSKIDPAFFDNLKDFNLSGAGLDLSAPNYQVPLGEPVIGYATGGEVRKFQRGGAEGELEDPMEAFLLQQGIIDSEGSGPMPMPAVEGRPITPPVTRAVAPPEMQANLPPVAGRPDLMTLLGKYAPQGNTYGAELAEARKTATAETAAFNAMLQKAISEPGSQGPSKSEMYFRLAAAFGAPTKTGAFSENLAKAGEVLSEQKKAVREASSAERARKLQLGLQAQQAKMAGAKEDLGTLRTLAGEEMKDKRTIAAELLKDYVRSGQPQSSAGKQALDEGLRPGTPEYQKRVGQISELNVDRQMGQIQATLANLGLAQANAALQGQKFEFQQEQASKLTAPEMKLKTETEDLLAQTAQGYKELKRALALNPNTFDTSLVDTVQRKALEAVGSKDPKVVNTRELENVLQKAALSQLKATFGGAISDGERASLQATQGMESKSIEERARIMQNAADALKSIYARNKKRLNEINQGAYRATQMPGEE
jgi:hypothetical protein